MNEVAKEYRRLLELRKAYHPAADIDWDNDPVILGMVKTLSADVDATVAFLGECTADEFGWLSEIFGYYDIKRMRFHNPPNIISPQCEHPYVA